MDSEEKIIHNFFFWESVVTFSSLVFIVAIFILELVSTDPWGFAFAVTAVSSAIFAITGTILKMLYAYKIAQLMRSA